MATRERLNKVSVATLFLLVASGCATLESYEYIRIARPSTGNAIGVATVDEFVKLLEAYGTEHVLVYRTDTRRQSQFTIVHDGVVYTVEGKGFETIADYQDGTAAGFEIGIRFYRAIEHGLEQSRENFDRYLLSYFLSPDDYNVAVASGLYQKPTSETVIAYPHTVAADDFQTILLPLLVRAQLERRLSRPETTASMIRGKIEELELSTDRIIASPAIRTERPRFGTSNRQDQETSALLARVRPEQLRILASAIAAEIISTNGLHEWRLPYEKIGTDYVATSTTGWHFDEPSMLFYLAPIYGYSDLLEFRRDYAEIVAARQNQYNTLADYRDAEARGFPSSDFYYHNRTELGFDRYEQYKQFRELRVSVEEFNETYRALLNDLNSIRSGMSEGSWYEAIVLYVISQIDRGNSVSLGVLKHRVDWMFQRSHTALSNLDGFLPSALSTRPRSATRSGGGLVLATDTAFDLTLNDRTEEISVYGTLSRANAVFTRR